MTAQRAFAAPRASGVLMNAALANRTSLGSVARPGASGIWIDRSAAESSGSHSPPLRGMASNA